MTTAAVACVNPRCTGTLDGGYCNVCGLAATPAPALRGIFASAPSSASRRRASQSISTSAPRSSSLSTRQSRPGSGRSSRGRLGAGLVEILPIPARDPAGVVIPDPQVPERKRFCGDCGHPIGRSRHGQPGLAEGFCAQCGSRFSFTPKLVPGELVGGQYEVVGCLAHGGLGWLYLAADHNLAGRWVVLKGLLNSGDADAQQAALAERQFLAQVEHPNIVSVYNFVEHADFRSGELTGYIVMEYVGGKSLKQILLEQRQAGRSLPLPAALAYVIELLPALGYLHSRGLVYCDFKPENAIQTEEQLKLIDMGGVRRIDDDESPIYGTVGFQAPEIADAGPSPSSDLYSVGRALAVLSFEFTGYQSAEFSFDLPEPATVPLLAEQESFFRALRRATDPEPTRRFGSASEMAEQLTGVLREVLSVDDQHPRPAFSALFSPELQAIGVASALLDDADAGPAQQPPPSLREIVAGLPVPQVDTADPAAGYLMSLSTAQPEQRIVALRAAIEADRRAPAGKAPSAETRLALARSSWTGICRAPTRSSATWPRAISPTGGPRGTRACASWRAATPKPRVPCLTASTTRCPVNWPPSSRSASPPRRRAGSRLAAGSSWCGPSTGPMSAPRSDWPGPGCRPATGPAPSPRSPRCRRPRATTWPRRSLPCGYRRHRPAASSGCHRATCRRLAAGLAG
jgi:serine/threonine-protein kinase PknG